jgi:hypothetical protein
VTRTTDRMRMRLPRRSRTRQTVWWTYGEESTQFFQKWRNLASSDKLQNSFQSLKGYDGNVYSLRRRDVLSARVRSSMKCPPCPSGRSWHGI